MFSVNVDSTLRKFSIDLKSLYKKVRLRVLFKSQLITKNIFDMVRVRYFHFIHCMSYLCVAKNSQVVSS